MKRYIMRYSEAGVQGFCPLPSTLCYNCSTRFPELVRPFFLLLDSFFVLRRPCLHAFVIGEHNSRSVVSDMTLYYAQYKHTKFRRRSCLRINQLTFLLTLFLFWFSSTFCSKFCSNFSDGNELFL